MFTLWRLLLTGQIREQPGRLAVTVVAITLGVALAAAVAFVNATALTEFATATRRLIGEADIVIRGAPEGFADELFVRLARDPRISLASPVLELDVALAGRRETLRVLGIDPFRAEVLQPALIGDIGAEVLSLFADDGIFLSGAAAQNLHLARGDRFNVIVGNTPKALQVLGVLAPGTYSQALGLMDIASAQWTFERLGRLNRIDLRLPAGADVEAVRTQLAQELPAGMNAIAPEIERDRAVTVTRAYRVNLNMLALVALWTGAFLVFSTQSLAVLRRRQSLALLRALGVRRSELQWALIGEGAALGAIGGILGVALGVLLAALMLHLLSGDLGNSQLRMAGATLRAQPWLAVGFCAIGMLVAALGSWLPARKAAQEPPARALKGADSRDTDAAQTGTWLGLGLCGAGAVLANLPPVWGLPLFGYAAVAALLFGAVFLVPALTIRILRKAPRTGRVETDLAMAQLRENVGLSTLSLSAIIVSFSLMVAMAIMVYSFRASFEHWLGKLLPADIEMRVPPGNDTAFWSPTDQADIAAVAGIERVRFRRSRQLLLDPARPAVTLIARDLAGQPLEDQLPLVQTTAQPTAPDQTPVWISESLADLYHLTVGGTLSLPLGGAMRSLYVRGIWRDYAHSTGTVVMDRAQYITLSADQGATDASVWLVPGAASATVQERLRTALHDTGTQSGALEIMTSAGVRERSLQIFDRAFAITYALEAIAVLIGLAGISFSASATALARRAEFGMLRHIGLLRGQVLRLITAEGLLLSIFGVAYGLALGSVLSLVLVYVINRQSFNWSIDLSIPFPELGIIGVILIAASAVTSTWSGRAAMSEDAVRAVREDW